MAEPQCLLRPAIEALVWAPRVPLSRRTTFEGAAQKEIPGFEFREMTTARKLVAAGSREEYFPSYYAESHFSTRFAAGFDSGSDPARREAIARARDTGKPVSSGRIVVLREGAEHPVGFVIFQPVYRHAATLATTEQRREAFTGVVFGVLTVSDLINAVLDRFESANIALALYDNPLQKPEGLLATWSPKGHQPPRTSTPDTPPKPQRRVPFETAGRTWLAVLTPANGQFGVAPTWGAWGILIVGATLSLLLAGYLESNRKHAQSMRELSITDPLTGLCNRRYLWDLLQRELIKARRNGTSLSAIMIDIDHFKRFNDVFGHSAGDVILKELGTLLKTGVRASDVACRWGGEEFVVILPEASLEIAYRRAEEFRLALKRLELKNLAQPLGAVTASLGIAAFPVHADDAEALLRKADEALYEAKVGRDRTIIYGSKEASGAALAGG